MKGAQDAHRLVVSGKATVKNWTDTWLEEFVKPNRAPKTYISYYGVLKQHMPARIANMGLTKLATEDVQRLLNEIKAGGHARSAALLRSVLRASFNKATRMKPPRMPFNPVLGTDPVTYTSVETATFNMEQGMRFLQAAETDRLGAMFTIMLSLGLREGEGAGLKAEDVDLDKRIVHVRRSLQWLKLPGEKEGRWTERPPKAKSKRDLPMTETIYRAIVRHMARREAEAAKTKGWKDSGYLFTSVMGAPLHPRNVLEAFHKLCDVAGVPRMRVHDTRHSCGTLLHVQHADPFMIQEVLGHSQLSTTRRYTHVPIEVTTVAVTGLESGFEAERKKQEEKRRQEEMRAAAEAKIEAVPSPTTLVQ
jgi:integrase